jgi:antitoxin component of RelBE/YafQ-DinJ toxin-antitoxin module
METKLTLRLDKKIIDRAKDYAQNHNISLSKMVESFLDSLTKQKSKDIEITPLVESLSGVVKLPKDFDYKKEYANYLTDKYK